MIVLGIAGWSGAGKTTLAERLIACLCERGLEVATIKHAHHGFDIDRPGKDSWRHRAAGARQVLLLGDQRWVLMREAGGAKTPTLDEQLAWLHGADVVLIEGFKHLPIAKIEVYRAALGQAPLWPHDPDIMAVASDASDLPGAPRRFDLDDAAGIVDWLLTLQERSDAQC